MSRALPALTILAAFAVAWALAGHLARASTRAASAANYSISSNSSAGSEVAAATALPSPTADAYAWLPDVAPSPLALPYDAAEGWWRTQGPHLALYAGTPAVALDFAPPGSPPCPGAPPSPLPVRAAAPGVVDDTGPGYVSLRIARDGTAIMLYHVEDAGKVATGTRVATGDALGYVGCTYGMTTGPHLHVALARAGEWLPAPAEWMEP